MSRVAPRHSTRRITSVVAGEINGDSPPVMIEEVLVFGDSIVMGLWDEQGGWAERLWKGRSRIVYNLGVDGNTSDDVAARFLSEAQTRGINKNSIVIFAVGINDSSLMKTLTGLIWQNTCETWET